MSLHAADSPGGHRRSAIAIRLAVVLATAGCPVALCACGSSGGGGTTVGATTATGNASPLGLSECMREHGIANFPDSGNGPGGQGLTIFGRRPTPGMVTPAFRRALSVCGALRQR